MTLLINDDEVRRILTVKDFLESVEDAYREYGLKRAGADGFRHSYVPPPKRELRIEGKGLPHGSPVNTGIAQGMASLERMEMAVIQHSFRFHGRKGGMFHLIDTSDGKTLAVVMNNDGYISQMRTAADGAIASKYLSRKDSTVAGIIGTGRQGKTQLEFLTKIRPIRKAYAYSGRRRDDDYAREMRERLGIEVIATDGSEEVVRNSDVLVAVTRATAPIVRGEWLNEGTHITSMGADCPLKVELDSTVLRRADKLVIDCEQCLEVAQLRIPIELGILKLEDIYGNIGEVLAGVKPSREEASEITVYTSTGMTVPYVAICARIHEKAKRMGLGTETSSIL